MPEATRRAGRLSQVELGARALGQLSVKLPKRHNLDGPIHPGLFGDEQWAQASLAKGAQQVVSAKSLGQSFRYWIRQVTLPERSQKTARSGSDYIPNIRNVESRPSGDR